jgi:uracil permease
MIVGLSGAKLTFGTVTVQGMVLATLVAILLSLLFHLFEHLGLMEE